MMIRDALLSPCERYRYRLSRTWDTSRSMVAFVLLNPSTADAERDDMTVTKCVGFAEQWGYGRIEIANLFALRASKPEELRSAVPPQGPDNDEHLRDVLSIGCAVVVGWGASIEKVRPSMRASAMHAFIDMAHELHRPLDCIGRTSAGHPRHPSRTGYATQLETWAA